VGGHWAGHLESRAGELANLTGNSLVLGFDVNADTLVWSERVDPGLGSDGQRECACGLRLCPGRF
jgi:hypothetical protein